MVWEDSYKHCGECGSDLGPPPVASIRAGWQCRKCGSNWAMDMKFCGNCATPLSGAAQTDPPSATSTNGGHVIFWLIVALVGIGFWVSKDLPSLSSSGIHPRQVTYSVTGTEINRASITYQNESGGTEQREVDLPWTSGFPGRRGQFLYISAQKPSERGTVKVAIDLDGTRAQQAESNSPYGIATASARVD